jgi:hypothetical protein
MDRREEMNRVAGMKKNITTAEEAARTTPIHGNGFTSIQMLCAIGDIRRDSAELANYLTHPEIIVGLAEGRFGVNGLKRRLAKMAAADSSEGFEQ